MTPEAIAARKAYMKKWRHNNKDKIQKYQRDYWDKKAKECIEDGTNNE